MIICIYKIGIIEEKHNFKDLVQYHVTVIRSRNTTALFQSFYVYISRRRSSKSTVVYTVVYNKVRVYNSLIIEVCPPNNHILSLEKKKKM